MATITLEYNTRNIQAKKTLEYILSMGFFKTTTHTPNIVKSRLERSLEDVEKGNEVNEPIKWTAKMKRSFAQAKKGEWVEGDINNFWNI